MSSLFTLEDLFCFILISVLFCGGSCFLFSSATLEYFTGILWLTKILKSITKY